MIEVVEGYLPMLVLAVLSDAPRHSHAILQAIEAGSGDEGKAAALCRHEGELHPILIALEKARFIRGEWKSLAANANGSARRVYTLTDAGREEMKRQIADWKSFSGAIDRVLGSIPDIPGNIPIICKGI